MRNESLNSGEQKINSSETIQSKCASCGGALLYSPDNLNLVCEYCGSQVELNLTPVEIVENSYDEHVKNPDLHTQNEVLVAEVMCGQCGAHTTFPENITSFNCAFCGTPIVLKEAVHNRSWKPEYILPFKIAKSRAQDAFKKWLKGIWFAPSKLSAQLSLEQALKGIYLPYWTYDADTTTYYRGERGVSQTIAVRVNGKTQYRTVTNWLNVSGQIAVTFDDVLTPASNSLPPKIANALTNWDRANYVQYNDVYLRGFLSELYQHDFITNLREAKNKMEEVIQVKVRQDIGGDSQRIHDCNVQYSDIKFKHVLLPVWLSAYRYKGKSYIFAVNGRTGEVKGEHPLSAFKITCLVVIIVAILAFILCNF